MPKKKKRGRIAKIDVDQILLHKRQVFLFGVIDEKLATATVKKLIALDRIKSAPIALYINSPGGTIAEGFAIIDAIKGCNSPIVTLITGRACSMAGLISVAGQARTMTRNSVWMGHDVTSGNIDYVTKIIDHTDYLKELQKRVLDFLRKHTKLSEAELTKARNGELWLYPKDCLKKGIVDKIIG